MAAKPSAEEPDADIVAGLPTAIRKRWSHGGLEKVDPNCPYPAGLSLMDGVQCTRGKLLNVDGVKGNAWVSSLGASRPITGRSRSLQLRNLSVTISSDHLQFQPPWIANERLVMILRRSVENQSILSEAIIREPLTRCKWKCHVGVRCS